ncbi:MAG: hypothetical protein Tsb0021_08620 [Chlamydiales bacterium]
MEKPYLYYCVYSLTQAFVGKITLLTRSIFFDYNTENKTCYIKIYYDQLNKLEKIILQEVLLDLRSSIDKKMSWEISALEIPYPQKIPAWGRCFYFRNERNFLEARIKGRGE